ncbi:MAG: diacylglycerol kinase [Candidatus Goldiibacteriota bacterium HGW-Goldbacteria-1]|jgi:diacylglycerol kinase|nr:MAG: diacylglycerol kinase [Candidatus Goldiibacteriota bacterium HGW-Goldbacteria-1]
MSRFNKFIKSLGYAINGIIYAFKEQHNIVYMLIIGLIAIVSIFIFKISRIEAVIVIIICFAVIILEIFNTALEKLIDKLHPKQNIIIGIVKDMLAGAVLLASVMAVVVGIMIFLRPFLQVLKSIFSGC